MSTINLLQRKQPQESSQTLQLSIDPIGSYEDLIEVSTQISAQKSAYQLICLFQSSGQFHVDMQQYELAQECVFFIKPGQHYTAGPESLLDGYIVSFGESLLGIHDENNETGYPIYLMQFFSCKQVIWLNAGIMDDLVETIAKMIKELNNQYAFRSEILKRYFKIFLVYLTRQFEAAVTPDEQVKTVDLIKYFMALLERDFLSKKKVSDYATDLCVTPNYLNQIVKKMTGQSAGQHIRQRIVLEAKRKAIYSSKRMKEIAYYLGFSDPYHFSKFFKKETGLNFIDFRKGKAGVPLIPE